MGWRFFVVAAAIAVLSGCAGNGLKTAVDKLNEFGESVSSQFGSLGQSTGSSAGKNSLLRSPLNGVLRTSLSTDGSAPEWPKVAIENLRIPPGQLTPARNLSLKPNECVTFDAVLWRTATAPERINGLSLCASELPKQSNNFVLTWSSFSISGKTTGQVRTEGPTPPYNKLPPDSVVQQWMTNQFGLYYIGSMLTLVGYDPNFTIDDRRFWIVNVKH